MNIRILAFLVVSVLATALAVTGFGAATVSGEVVDSVTGKAIAGAIVTAEKTAVVTNSAGQFTIKTGGTSIMARASGYRAITAPLPAERGPLTIHLSSFQAKALYLSFYGIGSRTIREAAFNTIYQDHSLNAVVIDVKGDLGLTAFKTKNALAQEAGATRITTIPDLPALLKDLHARGLYTIARIVVFKDDPLASFRTDLAVKTATGALFRDREDLAWTDPFRREVWDYNAALAVEAAQAGFDEIQFDYVRFPDAKDAQFSQANTRAARVAAINGFLAEAREQLKPYNVFLAVDVFGYVCWNVDDTGIGQQLESIVSLVDYVSPMLYPSGFSFGIPGYSDPVAHPGEIVQLSLERALARTHVSPLMFRPWLQAFKDYAFDRRVFDTDEIQAQIDAAENSGAGGWMLWNPRNDYAQSGF